MIARLGVLLVLLGSSLAIVAPVAAHATLEQSTPGSGATVASLPRQITLRFDEAVGLLPGSVQVLGPEDERVDRGSAAHPGGDGALVAVGMEDAEGHAPRGTYLVSWRVVSADSHPVSGAFTFSVGRASAVPTARASGTDGSVSVLLGVSRWLGYAGAAVLLGGAVFVAACWPVGARTRRVRQILLAGAAALVVGAVLGLLLKGPDDAALGLGAVGRGALLSEVVGSTYGKALLARLVLSLLAAVLVLVLARDAAAPSRRGSAPLIGGSLVALGVLGTFAAAGHAVSSRPVAVSVAVDMAHVAAMSVWLGGLTLLVVVVLAGADGAEAAVRRFSPMAAWAVVVLVATGTYQSWRELGAWQAFTDTTYGRELIVKLVVVALVLLVAGVSRALVRRGGAGSLTALRRTVALEAVGGVVVLAVTSALVATEPGRTAYHPTVATTLTLGPDTVQVSGVPTGDRTMSLHLEVLDAAGRPTRPPEVSAVVSLPSRSIGPLPVRLVSGDGHLAGVVAVPVTGDWQLTVTVRTTAIDSYSKAVTLPIR